MSSAMDDAAPSAILLAPAGSVTAISNQRADAIDDILKKAQADAAVGKDSDRISTSQSPGAAAATTKKGLMNLMPQPPNRH